MPLPPLDSTHGQATSCVACYHRLWAEQTVERRRAWHAIIAFWAANTVEQRRAWHALIAFRLADTVGRRWAWHAIIALGRQTWSKQRQAWHAIIAFGQHRSSDDVGHCMPSSPLASTHSQTTSGVACHHRLWAAHTIERCRALHAIIAFGQHTRSDDVGRGMTSPPLDSTHGRQRRAWHDDITALGQHTRSVMSSVTLHHRPWTANTVDNVGRGMTLPPLDSTHGRQRQTRHDITALGQHTRSVMTGVALHHRPWTAHTVGNVGHGMTSPPLDSTHDR